MFLLVGLHANWPYRGIYKHSNERLLLYAYIGLRYAALTFAVLYAGYGTWQHWQRADFWRITLPYFGLAGVGVCSAAFHGTMKLQAQWCRYLSLLLSRPGNSTPFYTVDTSVDAFLADDLSMFFATGIILHRVMSFDRTSKWSRSFALGLSGILALVAVYHCYAIETAAHQATFVIMVILVARKTKRLISERIKDQALKVRMEELAKQGTSMCLFNLHFQRTYNPR